MQPSRAKPSALRAYATVCAGIFALVVIALALLVAFVDLGLSVHGIIALFIGAILTTGLAMGLMALVFLSDRGGRDADVHNAAGRRPDRAGR